MTRTRAATLFGLVLIGLAGGSSAVAGPRPLAVALSPDGQLFIDALETAERLHVTPIDETKAVQAALGALMRSLDPGSAYLSPEAMNALPNRRPTVALGVRTSNADGAAKVISVAEGGAAAKAGLRVGDYVVAVDGQTVLGKTDLELRNLLGGPPGQSVRMTVIRDQRERLVLTAVRESAAPETVIARREGDYGYLRVSRLDEATTQDTEAALARLRSARPDLKGLVLDLRDNSGGLLDQAVGVADLFLDKGVVLSQRGRTSDDSPTYAAHPGDALGGLPLVVLINAETASGAEIIAAALQDNHRARLVGQTSYGAGSIQTVVPLAGGTRGALKVTTAVFTRPSGQTIEGVGVTPDVAVTAPEDSLARALALLKAEPARPGKAG